ncbi:MAG: sulfotransferase family 2 domain-containing protein [Alkalilacustris sp.]
MTAAAGQHRASPVPTAQAVFTGPVASPQRRRAGLESAYAGHAAQFESRSAHDRFMSYIVTPASGRWAFVPNGKTATTSALALLFRLEFGHPLSVALDDPTDLNRDPAPHRLARQGVFRFLHERRDVASLTGYLDATLRLATVRHPLARAVSGFGYLCLSNRRRHPQFAADRARMCALVGFDWERHPDTSEGFLRFLDYVRWSLEAAPHGPDNHWAPQWMTLRPEVFRPHIIGRVEAFDAFAAAVTDRLGHRPDDLGSAAALNATGPAPDWAADPAVARAVAQVYARDFEEFEYDT